MQSKQTQLGIGITTQAFGIVGNKITQHIPLSEIRSSIKHKIYEAYDKSRKHHNFLAQFNIKQEINKQEDNYTFKIKVVENQALKPTIQKQGEKDPLSPPYEPGQFVMDIRDQFTILLNKFPVHPYHSLLITKEFIHQKTPQTKELLMITYDILKALKGFAFFNSCQEAGASLPHKHIQVVPETNYESADVLVKVSQYYKQHCLLKEKYQLAKLHLMKNVKHFICFYPSSLFHEDIEETHYGDILNDCYLNLIQAFGHKLETVENLKHNLIITSEFMMMVERRSDKFKGISVNAVGFTGSFLAKNIDDLKVFQETKKKIKMKKMKWTLYGFDLIISILIIIFVLYIEKYNNERADNYVSHQQYSFAISLQEQNNLEYGLIDQSKSQIDINMNLDKQLEINLESQTQYTLLGVGNKLQEYQILKTLGIDSQDTQIKRVAAASIISILLIAGCCACSQIIQAYAKACKQSMPPSKQPSSRRKDIFENI